MATIDLRCFWSKGGSTELYDTTRRSHRCPSAAVHDGYCNGGICRCVCLVYALGSPGAPVMPERRNAGCGASLDRYGRTSPSVVSGRPGVSGFRLSVGSLQTVSISQSTWNH